MKQFLAGKRCTTARALQFLAFLVAASPGMGQETGNGSRFVRKSSEVLVATAVKRVDPEYPPLARAAHVSGQVVVEVTVNEQGDVITASAVSGHPLLKAAAEEAARGWKFQPTTLSGVPVRVVGNLPFIFPDADSKSTSEAQQPGGIPMPPSPEPRENGVAAPSKEELMKRGRVEGQLYSNAYFGFSLPIPEGWHIQGEESRDRIIKAGGRLIVGEDQKLKALIESPRPSSAMPLAVFRYPIGSPVPFNPSFALVIEDVGGAPGIKRGSDYLYHVKRLMQAAQVKPTLGEEIYSKNLGGVDFDVLDVALDLGVAVVRQRYYTTIVKGHALSVIIAYNSEDDLKALTQVLDSVKFQ